MKKIDKGYLNVILKNTRKKSFYPGAKYKILLNIASNNKLRNFFITLLNKYGYTRLLSLIESDDVYSKVPIKIADNLGRRISPSYKPQIPTIQERVAKLSYHEDTISHIKIQNAEINFLNKMIVLCPTKCYSQEEDRVILQHEGCIECVIFAH
jgi:electron transfer flavoprotein-quinone oxidoreductase